MTRANLNYVYQEIGHSPATLYLYYNGDQYPRGLRDYFKVEEFINSDWSKKAFIEWIGRNYKKTQAIATTYSNGITIQSNYEPTEIPDKPRRISHPCIYHDDAGFPTDYSYIFDRDDKKVTVYEWKDKVFEGNAAEFIAWLKDQK